MGYLSNLLKSYYEEDKPQQTPPSAPLTQSTPTTQPQADSPSQTPTPPTQSQSPTPTTPSSPLDTTSLYATNPRARTIKQLSVFLSGACLLATTTLITRRAILRKLRLHTPKFYTPTNHRPTDANGAVEAAEAFALATVNVGALGLLLTGGAMFAVDVVSAEDLREKFKAKRGFVSVGKEGEEGADEEIEEWVRGVLGKKEGGDYKGVAEGLTALVGVLAGKEEDKEKLARMVKEEKEKEVVKEEEKTGDS